MNSTAPTSTPAVDAVFTKSSEMEISDRCVARCGIGLTQCSNDLLAVSSHRTDEATLIPINTYLAALDYYVFHLAEIIGCEFNTSRHGFV